MNVQWPQGDKIVAAPKNDGVTATIKQTPGAIGYIEYGYAKLTRADIALLQTRSANMSRQRAREVQSRWRAPSFRRT